MSTPCPTAPVCVACLRFMHLFPDVAEAWLCPHCGGDASVSLQSLPADDALTVLQREGVQMEGPPLGRAA